MEAYILALVTYNSILFKFYVNPHPHYSVHDSSNAVKLWFNSARAHALLRDEVTNKPS